MNDVYAKDLVGEFILWRSCEMSLNVINFIAQSMAMMQEIWLLPPDLPLPPGVYLQLIRQVRRSRTTCVTLEVGCATQPQFVRTSARYWLTGKMSVNMCAFYIRCHPMQIDIHRVYNSPLLHDARRTFLTSLVLASKFQQDLVYSNKACATLSGLLSAREGTHCETALGSAHQWRLWLGRHVQVVNIDRLNILLLNTTINIEN